MSDVLTIKERNSCLWDAASLGEIMLRLDPGDGRIHTAREFRVWEGGGEYNVVRGLRRCFGMRTTAVTAFADNPVGRLVERVQRVGLEWRGVSGGVAAGGSHAFPRPARGYHRIYIPGEGKGRCALLRDNEIKREK